MSIPSSVAAIGEAIANWLNPTRKERVILLQAIRAAKELLKILRHEGKYKDMPLHKQIEWEIHFQKQLDAWEDGTP